MILPPPNTSKPFLAGWAAALAGDPASANPNLAGWAMKEWRCGHKAARKALR